MPEYDKRYICHDTYSLAMIHLQSLTPYMQRDLEVSAKNEDNLIMTREC